MALRRSRGALESAVLHILWDATDPLTAREVRQRVDPGAGTPALTTVLTVLDRLRVKGQVHRLPREGAGHLFTPARTESGHVAEAMVSALDGATDRDAALLRFTGRLAPHEVELLRRALPAASGTGALAAPVTPGTPGTPGTFAAPGTPGVPGVPGIPGADRDTPASPG
ncbi:MAG: BlaI/MecI/CopY family transcriptional regulator [Kineosporiaceae bacterium]